MAKRGSIVDLFLDSSVLFSAVYSVTGGSAKLFTLKSVNLYASKLVLTEVERNVREGLQNYHLKRLFMLVDLIKIIEYDLNENEIRRAKAVIVEKDALILGNFKKSVCNYLATLDKKDFLQEKVFEFVKPKKILTPKDFFGQELP